MTCGYQLHGLAEHRCPECGRPFDPADPKTMSKINSSALKHWPMHAPGWIFHLTTAVLAMAMLVAWTPPGGYFSLVMLSLIGWVLFGGIWCLRLVITLGLMLYHHDRPPSPLNWAMRWMVAPLIVCLTLGLIVKRVPLRAGFRLSRPAMQQLAQQVMAVPPGGVMPADRFVGIYHASSAEQLPWGMRFEVKGAGFMDRCGFAYSPAGPPLPTSDDHYTRLYGGWYIWREVF